MDLNRSELHQFSEQAKQGFDDKGYLIVRNILDDDELERVVKTFEESDYIKENSYASDDGAGRKTRVACWKNPGDDVTGMVTRSERIVKLCELLLGGEVYHYHSKINMKEAKSGGRFVWHQDYGYWYQNGFLRPDMMSVFIALDKSTQANGCLQILEGSHKCGRVEHCMVGGQTGADIERVEAIKARLPLKNVELMPGDAVFFHCNVLHTSGANTSQFRRWVFISCYNRVNNPSPRPHHFASSGTIDIVPDSAIRTCANLWNMASKNFLRPQDNPLIEAEPVVS